MLHRKGQKRYWTDLSLLGQEPTFNELPGYLIMPLPEIANDKKKTRMLPKENETILSSNYLILTKSCIGNVCN